MQASKINMHQNSLEYHTDFVVLQQMHSHLDLHFDASLLRSTSNSVDFGRFLERRSENFSMILLPAAVRRYYPLLAAAYSIKVKPLMIFSLESALLPLSNYENIQVEKMVPIRDSTQIRKLLGLAFTDESMFREDVSFRCLIAFEINSPLNICSHVEIVLSHEEVMKQNKTITIAVGITTDGIMYVYHSKTTHHNQTCPEMQCKSQLLIITLLRAVIITAITKLGTDIEEMTGTDSDHIYTSKSNMINNDNVRGENAGDILSLSVVLHVNDRDLLETLYGLRCVENGKEKNKNDIFYFDAILLRELKKKENFEEIISCKNNNDKARSDNISKINKIEIINMKYIFLLIGQSNMAGRGDITELKYCYLNGKEYGKFIFHVLFYLFFILFLIYFYSIDRHSMTAIKFIIF